MVILLLMNSAKMNTSVFSVNNDAMNNVFK